MDLSKYAPNEIEVRLSKTYRDKGIHHASDIDIHHIAEIANTRIVMCDEYKSIWDDDFGLIFLNAYDHEEDKRRHFFHELGHIMRHAGSQFQIPESLMELQEFQANSFKLYAAMPAYMLHEFQDIQYLGMYYKVLAEEFKLPISFVKKRIEQVRNRIFWAEQQERLHEASMKKAPKVSPEYIRALMAEHGRKRLEEKETRKRG